jgi:dual specificity protein kinase YAK1
VNDILGSEETGHKYISNFQILQIFGRMLMMSKESLSYFRCAWPRHFRTSGEVPEPKNTRGCCGESGEESHGILQSEYDGSFGLGFGNTLYYFISQLLANDVFQLNSKLDKNDDHHLLRLKDTFIHRQHLCLVFELLSVNLYELIKQNQFRGLSTTLVRVFAQQLLTGLSLLNKARLIHCDLKPENILLKNLESPIIKIIDFGSACDERQTVYTYIQSRFYRSPEVLLGLPYSSAIDMWSLGCIVVELFLGLPLFPGSSEYNQVSRIVEMLGMPPNWMLEMGKQAGEFFEKRHDVDDYGRRTYHLKSMEQYSREHGTKEQPSKKYFQATTLPEIIRSYAMPRKNMKQSEIDRGRFPPYLFLQ